jgi:hypothetical protein
MSLVTVITRFLFLAAGKPRGMSDASNENAQLLDEDVIPEEYPPEQPYGVNERLTAEEEQVGESLEDRMKRERPDNLGQDVGRVGTLIDDAGEGGIDLEADAVATEVEPRLRRDQLDPSDPLRGDYSVQDREEVIPAEEAAMHLTEDPPMHATDGYVDD